MAALDQSAAAHPAPTGTGTPAPCAAAPRSPWRRALLGAGLAGGALAGAGCVGPGVVALPPQPLVAPRVREGDRWRYEIIDNYRREKQRELTARVVSTQPQCRVELLDAQGRRVGDELYTSPWQVLQEPFYDQVQIFEGPVPLLPNLGTPGSRQGFRTHYRVAGSDDRLYWDVTVEARFWERLRVPAGEFDTLRVQRNIRFQHSDRFRLGPPWRFETLWYAPQVNRWVQREWTGGYRWAGMRGSHLNEDWLTWRLLEHVPAAVAG